MPNEVCIIVMSVLTVAMIVSGIIMINIVKDEKKKKPEGYYYICIKKSIPKEVVENGVIHYTKDFIDLSSGNMYSSYEKCLTVFNELVSSKLNNGYYEDYREDNDINDKACPSVILLKITDNKKERVRGYAYTMLYKHKEK